MGAYYPPPTQTLRVGNLCIVVCIQDVAAPTARKRDDAYSTLSHESMLAGGTTRVSSTIVLAFFASGVDHAAVDAVATAST